MLNYDTVLSRGSFLLGIELRVFRFIAFLYALSSVLYLFHFLARSQPAFRGAPATVFNLFLTP